MRISDWSSDVCSSDVCSSDLSCRKPPRWNGTDKFAIPTSTAIGPSGVKQRRKNRFSREQTKRANVSQAIWKIRFALQACDLQEWQTENKGSHRTQHRKKGLELASVNQGSKSEERRVGKECDSTCRTRWTR